MLKVASNHLIFSWKKKDYNQSGKYSRKVEPTFLNIVCRKIRIEGVSILIHCLIVFLKIEILVCLIRVCRIYKFYQLT